MKKSNDNGLSRAEFQYLTPPDNEAPRTKQRPRSPALENRLLFPASGTCIFQKAPAGRQVLFLSILICIIIKIIHTTQPRK